MEREEQGVMSPQSGGGWRSRERDGDRVIWVVGREIGEREEQGVVSPRSNVGWRRREVKRRLS